MLSSAQSPSPVSRALTSSPALEDYVSKLDGRRTFRRVLIANNGVAATKGIRSLRKWLYEALEDDAVIKFVAMATPEDISCNAEYIRMVDEYVEVPGGSNINNYANVPLIVEIAKQKECDAVYAGWGHASENPLLPQSLSEAFVAGHPVTFLGPSAATMRALGDKIASTLVAQTLGVPTIAWSGSGLRCPPSLEVSPELFANACVNSAEACVASAKKIGFPVMIKASEGGGGKGIRAVLRVEDVAEAYTSVAREVQGSPVFVMALASHVRHIEVQLVADQYGGVAALNTRDCSVQRRHQKIIEEGPALLVPPETVREMELCAMRLASGVGYEGAGTVEYLYDIDSKNYYLLELNPRLQVEHPVTECITGINLPATLLLIGMGVPLHRIPDIRRAWERRDVYGDSPIDFFMEPCVPVGHTIAVRITAENPDESFRPSTGVIDELIFRPSDVVWGYFSVVSGGGIHEFADSQFGHLFARGTTREDARKSMVLALKQLTIKGRIHTTVEYLIALLEDEAFKDLRINTAWLDGLIKSKGVARPAPPAHLAVLCAAAYRVRQRWQGRVSEFKSLVSQGHLPSKTLLDTSVEEVLILGSEKFVVTGTVIEDDAYCLNLNDSLVFVELQELRDRGIMLRLGPQTILFYTEDDSMGLRINISGRTATFHRDVDPTSLRTSVPGKLVRYLVHNKDHIEADQAYAEVEVMKMLLLLRSPIAGTITLACTPGITTAAGAVLANIDPDDSSSIVTAKVVDYPWDISHFAGDGVDIAALESGASSYTFVVRSVNNLASLASQFSTRSHGSIETSLDSASLGPVTSAGTRQSQGASPRPIRSNRSALRSTIGIRRLVAMLRGYTVRPPEVGNVLLKRSISAILGIAGQNVRLERISQLSEILRIDIPSRVDISYQSQMCFIFETLLRMYLNNAIVFEDTTWPHALRIVRQAAIERESMDPPAQVHAAALANNGLESVNRVVIAILEAVSDAGLTSSFIPILTELDRLNNADLQPAVLAVRQLLRKAIMPSYQETRYELLQALHHSPDIETLVAQSTFTSDLISDVFFDSIGSLKQASIELYVRKLYTGVFSLSSLEFNAQGTCKWQFRGLEPVTVPESHVLTPLLPSRLAGSMNAVSELTDSYAPVLAEAPPSHRTAETPSRPRASSGSGALLLIDSLSRCNECFKEFVSTVVEGITDPLILYLAILHHGPVDAQDIASRLSEVITKHLSYIRTTVLDTLSFILLSPQRKPLYFTFRSAHAWVEDKLYRNAAPTYAHALELETVVPNFDLESYPLPSSRVFVYYGRQRSEKDNAVRRNAFLERRWFTRFLVVPGDVVPSEDGKISSSDIEALCFMALSGMDIIKAERRYPSLAYANHVFINILVAGLHPSTLTSFADVMTSQFGSRLAHLGVSEIELALESQAQRLVIRNPTRFQFTYSTITINRDSPQVFPLLSGLDRKRHTASSCSTVYAYDIPLVVSVAVERLWRNFLSDPSQRSRDKSFALPTEPSGPPAVVATELILDESSIAEGPEMVGVPSAEFLKELKLKPSGREPGINKIAMVCWRVSIALPSDYIASRCGRAIPRREFLLVANDITVQSGSFAPVEDFVFAACGQLAIQLNVPFVYYSANSGARIGIAEEVKSKYQVAWRDPAKPADGYDYLFLSDHDYSELHDSVQATRLVEPNGEVRWRLDAIIGREHGLGVENLRGSGLIAGLMSYLYSKVPTISVASGRTVGIGAYLVRLGRRVIQTFDSPILLTGAQALNNLLGRDVYTSNAQLGGQGIMCPNGVTHWPVKDDLHACISLVDWLNGLPGPRHPQEAPPAGWISPTVEYRIGSALTSSLSDLAVPCNAGVADPREVEWSPNQGEQYDPRLLLTGTEGRPGLVDSGSFVESLSDWAQSVVVGRARLEGIPVGVVAVETRVTNRIIPPDPADTSSATQTMAHAGNVWYPDSARKTADALEDFRRESLPVLILANWRGFSGGTRDMFDEVLKFGADIVDSLQLFETPVFVYMPPYAELRGGAWVVIDPTINPFGLIEMYADPSSRAGVLEPNAVAEIKYRDSQLYETMDRLDLTCQSMSSKNAGSPSAALTERRKDLHAIYRSVATDLAELHDVPARLKAKGVIHDILEWRHSRSYLADRLRYRLAEIDAARHIVASCASIVFFDALQEVQRRVKSYCSADRGRSPLATLTEHGDEIVNACVAAYRQEQLASLLGSMPVESVAQAVHQALSLNSALAGLITMPKVAAVASGNNGPKVAPVTSELFEPSPASNAGAGSNITLV